MKKRKLLVFAIIAVALIFLGGIYLNSDVYVTHQVNTKVNRVIQARNTKELKRISNDKTTYKFLISLSNSTRCKDTSDGSYVKNPDIKVRTNLTFNLNYLI